MKYSGLLPSVIVCGGAGGSEVKVPSLGPVVLTVEIPRPLQQRIVAGTSNTKYCNFSTGRKTLLENHNSRKFCTRYRELPTAGNQDYVTECRRLRAHMRSWVPGYPYGYPGIPGYPGTRVPETLRRVHPGVRFGSKNTTIHGLAKVQV